MMAAILGASALFVPSMSVREATDLQRHLEHWGKTVAAAALIEAVVRPDGTIQSCNTKAVVGDADMAADMCQWFLRYRVKPGKLGDGTKVYSVMTSVMMGFEPGTAAADRVIRNRPDVVDISLFVNRLPKGARPGQIQSAVVRIEADGKVSECEPRSKVPTDLAPALCAHARQVVMPIVIDDDGRPVTYVRSFGVRFELNRGPSR